MENEECATRNFHTTPVPSLNPLPSRWLSIMVIDITSIIEHDFSLSSKSFRFMLSGDGRARARRSTTSLPAIFSINFRTWLVQNFRIKCIRIQSTSSKCHLLYQLKCRVGGWIFKTIITYIRNRNRKWVSEAIGMRKTWKRNECSNFVCCRKTKVYVHEEIIFVSTWLFLASHSSR